jgi:hypothetical protein
MAGAILQKEKEAAEKRVQNEAWNAATNPPSAMKVGTTPKNQPKVVSPLSAPNLNSFSWAMSARTGRRMGRCCQPLTPLRMIRASSRRPKTPWKNSNKVKLGKDEKAAKRNCSGSVLKKSSFATSTVASSTPAKEYLHDSVFYEAGLELKGEDKYGAHMKQNGNLLENIQLVGPCTIMHAADETGGAKPLDSKTGMSNNMSIFLAYSTFAEASLSYLDNLEITFATIRGRCKRLVVHTSSNAM